jgi:DNA mismatch repair ATPase MutS
MEGRIDGVKNYRVMVKEWNGNIVFLHKILYIFTNIFSNF